jgi:hypothetical protein
MNIRKIIKQTLNEVAGISFEVREWAQILSNEIDRQVKEADEAEAAKHKDEEPEVEEQPSFSHATTYDESDSDFITHFEDLGGNAYDEAIVPGEELMYSSETIKDFPDISNIIKNKTIRVTIEDWGYRVSLVEGGLDAEYEEVLEDMVLEHAQWGQSFYEEDTYNDVMAVFEGDGVIEDDDDDGPSWSSRGWGSSGYNWGNWKPTPRADIQQLVINGQDFPEAYEKFSVDKWVFNQASRIEYDHYKSGYNDNGEYVVYFNVPIRGLSMGMFVHETKHAYDDWNRMRHGGKPIRDSWEIKNIYTKDFEKLILGGAGKYPRLGHVIRMYYMGSKLETPAYLENEYDSPSAQSYRTVGKKLMDFNINQFLNKKGQPARGLEEEFQDIRNNYDIPFLNKFGSVVDFLKYTQKYFNKRGKDIVRRIDKTLYVHGRTPKPTPRYEYKPRTERNDKPDYGTQMSLPF